MSNKPLLYYFEGRGLAEIIRLTLSLGGVEFEQRFVQTRQEFLKDCDDGLLVFRCLPYMKWGDLELGQSSAILRYVARKTGLMGKDDEEEARVNMMFEASRDYYKNFYPIGFAPLEPIISSVKETALPKFLPIFTKILAANGTGYLVGDKPTLADAGLLECLFATVEVAGEGAFEGHPEIQKYLHEMKSLPNIDNYLKNVRQPPNDENYVKRVRDVLGWDSENKPIKK